MILNRVGRDPESPLMCGAIGDLNFVNTPNTDAGPDLFQEEANEKCKGSRRHFRDGCLGLFEDDAKGMTVFYFTRSNTPTMVGDFDIYTATLAEDGTWGNIVRDNNPSTTPFRDTRTALRERDGLEMILPSERPGGLGDSRDLWVSTRASTLDP